MMDFVQEVEEHAQSLYVSRDLGPMLMPHYADWPRYPLDDYANAFAATQLPLLMLNGTLDPQTPLLVAQPTMDHFTGPHQTAVVVQRAAHSVLFQSPLDEFGTTTCGMELMRQFLADPHTALDTSCSDQVVPLNFAGSTPVTKILFGTTDAWDNSSASRAKATPPSGAEDEEAARRLLERLRHRLRHQLRATRWRWAPTR